MVKRSIVTRIMKFDSYLAFFFLTHMSLSFMFICQDRSLPIYQDRSLPICQDRIISTCQDRIISICRDRSLLICQDRSIPISHDRSLPIFHTLRELRDFYQIMTNILSKRWNCFRSGKISQRNQQLKTRHQTTVYTPGHSVIICSVRYGQR